jgi:Domain of unknown function (DUF4915)
MRPGETAAQRKDTVGRRKGLVGAEAEFAARIGDALGAVSQREIIATDEGLFGVGGKIEGRELGGGIGRDADTTDPGVVGLSLSRDGSFSGLALDDEMKKRDADGWCGVQIVNLASGDIVQWIRIEGAVSELYDVAVLPGVRRPMAASFTGPEINDPLTFEA